MRRAGRPFVWPQEESRRATSGNWAGPPDRSLHLYLEGCSLALARRIFAIFGSAFWPFTIGTFRSCVMSTPGSPKSATANFDAVVVAIRLDDVVRLPGVNRLQARGVVQ